jgi:secreted PhoX family phosphatase
VFEVPAKADGGLVKPEPLTALGRFAHESIFYDARSGVVYQTEDLHDGLFYRFVPTLKGDLRAGGRLQALALASGARESGNCAADAPRIPVGERLKVKWIDMDRVEAPEDDLRIRGHDVGACRFDRGEGMAAIDGSVYFTTTTGGAARAGQIWCYRPSAQEGRRGEARDPGTLELFYEVQDTTALLNPDNITAMPGGDLLVCEDPEHGPTLSRLVVMTRSRETRTFARSRLPGELSGAVFSPDRSTLFVNLQKAGITLAITGPWQH